MSNKTGVVMALWPVLLVGGIVGSLIFLDKQDKHVLINVVDHGYTAPDAAQLNRNVCTTYAPTAETGILGVNCQAMAVNQPPAPYVKPTGWRPTSVSYTPSY